MPLRVAAKAGPQDTRATNRRLVLQLLLRSEGASRADLARATELTPATISDLVGTLFDEGLIEQLGRGPVKVGKPSTLLGVKADARYVVCLDLSDGATFRGAVVDLAGEIRHRTDVSLRACTGEAALALAAELVADLVIAAPGPVLGVGVGTPGVVSPDGTVIEANNLGWSDLDLAQRLTEKFGLPVSVSNDANAAALAEYSYGNTSSQNLMVIKIGHGVGAGIVVNGQQYHGESFAAGEIGHIVVQDDGPLCRCGNHGCLETFVAVPRLQAAIAAGEDADAVVFDAGHQLGVALAAAISVLDIHDIVVAGSEIPLHSELCAAALATLRTRTLKRLGDAVTMRPSTLGDDVILLGANVLVLSKELGVA